MRLQGNMVRMFVLSLLLVCTLVYTQQKVYTFRASELSRTAQVFLDDSTAIPLLLAVATHDVATNTFSLSLQQQQQLQELRRIHRTVRECKQRTAQAVMNGAKVFASQLLDSLVAVTREYDRAVLEGSRSLVRDRASTLQRLTEELERRIERERLEPVDARLAEKTGTVDKRKGYLGKWVPASVGDLFVAYDGVRTYERSTALLSFTDGVDVTVDPNTTVIIRESSNDRLKQRKKKDIALVQGSLLARMDEKAKEENDLRLHTDEARSAVKSGRFWANVETKVKARLSNYDGTIDVAAQNVQITLRENQGTVVEPGKPPAKPIPLLPAPELGWERSDTTIYRNTLPLSWKPIDGAKQYVVERAPTKTFDHDVQRFTTNVPRVLLSQVPMGISYVRITAYDAHGLRGIDSPTLTVVRVEDTQPPPLTIEGWEYDTAYTVHTTVSLRGATESQATLTINGTPVPLDRTGVFTYTVSVQKPETKLILVATDLSGNTTRRTLTIVPIDTVRLFQVRWSCPEERGVLHSGGKEIEVHGVAYPSMRVRAVYGSQSHAVFTNTRGEWALVLTPGVGETVTILFELVTESVSVASRTWEVIQ